MNPSLFAVSSHRISVLVRGTYRKQVYVPPASYEKLLAGAEQILTEVGLQISPAQTYIMKYECPNAPLFKVCSLFSLFELW